MAGEFKIPELGENIKAGDVVKICVAVGDVVSVDQTLFELETDKAVVEVPSNFAGKVLSIQAKQGDKVKTGQTVITFESGASKAVSSVPEVAPKIEVAKVAEEKPIVTESVSSSAQNIVLPSPVVTQAPPKVETAPVYNQPKANEVIQAPQTEPRGSLSDVIAAPTVRRLAHELGVDITEVRGTGSAGRISIEDVKNYAKHITTLATQNNSNHEGGALPDFAKWGRIEKQPMSSVRRKTAHHLSEAWRLPHVTQFEKADITEIERLRKLYAGRAEKSGGKLTMTVILMKVLASALKKFPQFNASIDMRQEEIVYKNYYHLGVAVDTDRGLLVPVIRDVDKKNIIDLSKDLTRISDLAKQKKLSLEDMQGGTFTISNLGGIGGTYFTPIVNSPEVAILGVSQARMEPFWTGTAFEPRLMMPLSLSYDHRIIDGADAIRFLKWVVEALQQPFLMDLEG